MRTTRTILLVLALATAAYAQDRPVPPAPPDDALVPAFPRPTPTPPPAPPDPDAPPATEQTRIMARVLEDSLEASGLGDWRAAGFGVSALEPSVRGQYIPTVGAVFTIPISFPITEPPRVEASPEGNDPGADLWERNARSPSSLPEPPSKDAVQQMVKAQMEMMKRSKDAGSSRKKSEGSESGAVMGGLGMPGMMGGEMDPGAVTMGGGFGGGMGMGFGGAAPVEFDAKKVETLSRTLLEAVARYGRRMTRLEPEERVIVIVEAPSVRGGGQLSVAVEGVPSALGGFGAPGAIQLHWTGANTRDCLMLAVPKAALGNATLDSLSTQVKEVRF